MSFFVTQESIGSLLIEGLSIPESLSPINWTPGGGVGLIARQQLSQLLNTLTVIRKGNQMADY
jgi:hypothetical protein